ncbi:hypothetical protein LX36DRAFT_241894 [Colletotrichum falcatum]|nr:hypothetical protein LX36DRAFT_241894 [Colletotrichum falcatum]
MPFAKKQIGRVGRRAAEQESGERDQAKSRFIRIVLLNAAPYTSQAAGCLSQKACKVAFCYYYLFTCRSPKFSKRSMPPPPLPRRLGYVELPQGCQRMVTEACGRKDGGDGMERKVIARFERREEGRKTQKKKRRPGRNVPSLLQSRVRRIIEPSARMPPRLGVLSGRQGFFFFLLLLLPWLERRGRAGAREAGVNGD